MNLIAGPDSGSEQPTGLARVALEALAYCPRPGFDGELSRTEGSFPEGTTTLFDQEPRKA